MNTENASMLSLRRQPHHGRPARRARLTLSSLACSLMLAVAAIAADDSKSESTNDTWKPTHFVFLDTGSGDRSGTTREALQTMQADHLGNLGRLAREDKSRLAGPLGRESQKARGIVILSLPKGVDIASEFANDPFMKADFLNVRAYPWNMTTGKLRKPDEMTSLGEYVTVVVKRAGKTERAAAEKAYTLLEKELAAWTLSPESPNEDPADDDGGDPVKPLALAGAADAKDDVVGIMIFRISDIERVRDALDGTDALEDETLRYDAFRQYLGAGLID